MSDLRWQVCLLVGLQYSATHSSSIRYNLETKRSSSFKRFLCFRLMQSATSNGRNRASLPYGSYRFSVIRSASHSTTINYITETKLPGELTGKASFDVGKLCFGGDGEAGKIRR